MNFNVAFVYNARLRDRRHQVISAHIDITRALGRLLS